MANTTFKPLVTRNMGNDEDGNPLIYYEGTVEDTEDLPTEHVYPGSWALKLTDKRVVFFKGSTGSWG